MNILLTNDDGIDSLGIRMLAKYLSPMAKLWACVPYEQQSGSGHGLSVRETLQVRPAMIDGVEKAWSVEGKPADCVKLAFLSLLDDPVDLVISGINEGANLGTDTLYSGTVAAAMEGALNGAPAIAFSLLGRAKKTEEWNFENAAAISLTLYKKWAAGTLPIPPMSILNVNIPDLPVEKIKGYKAARLGVQRYSDIYELLVEKEDSRQYQLKGTRLPSHEDNPLLDIVLAAKGYVTLTPLSADRTDLTLLREIEKIKFVIS